MSINFSVRFSDNVADLKKHLAEGLDQIEATRASVDKLARSLGGENVIKSAHNLAAAIQKIGGEAGVLAGVEKLTFAELERGNAVLDRAVQKYLAMGQAIPTPIAGLHALIKAEVDAGHAAEEAAKQQDQQSSVLRNFSQQVLSTAAGFVSAQAVIGAVRGAFRAIIGELETSVKAYADAEGAQIKLTAAMRQHGLATPQIVKQYNDLATEFQDTTVASDDLITKMESLLTQVGGVMPSQMKAALQASSDLSAGLGIDLESATTLVAKAASGHTETLGRYGITVSDAALKSQGFAAVLEAVNRQFGGQAAAQVETYTGQIQQLKNAWNNVEEVIGRNLVTNPLVVRGMRELEDSAKDLDKSSAGAAVSLGDVALAITNSGEFSAVIRAWELLVEGENNYIAATRRALALPNPFANLGQLGTVSNVDALKSWDEELARNKKAADAAKAAAEAHARALQNLADEFSGAGLLKSAKDYETTIARIGGIERLSAAEKRRLADEFQKVIDKYRVFGPAGKAVVEHFADLKQQLEPIPQRLLDIEDGFHGATNAIEGIGTKIKVSKDDLDAFTSNAELLKIYEIEHAFAGVGDTITKMGLQIKPVGPAIDKVKDSSKSLATSLGTLSNDIAQLSQISGQTLGPLIRDFGLGVKGAEQMTRAMDSVQASIKATGSISAGAAIDLIGFAISVANLTSQMIDAHREAERLKRSIQFAEEIGRDFGVVGQLSQSLSAEIESLAFSFEHMYHAGDSSHAFAQAIKLSDIIEELGGLTALTAEQLAMVRNRTDELFDVIALGGKAAVLGTKELDTVLNDMGQTAAEKGGLVDKFFLDAAKHAADLGIELKGVAEFMQGQALNAETGIGGALKVTNDAYAKRKDLQKQIADLTAQSKDQTGENAMKTAQQLEELNAQLKIQDQIIGITSIHSQAAAEAVSGSLLDIINSQVKAGKSYGDAIREVAPSIQSLQQQLGDLHLTGGAAFDILNSQVALFTDEVSGPALQSIEGYAKGLVGLNNAGLLNQDTFAGISEQIGATRDALVAQGKDGGQVLQAMRGPLQTLWELEQKFGYTTDESTQALIDQAKEQGLVGDKFKPIGEQMLDATNRIADAVEGLAELFGVLPKAAKDAATGMSDELGRIRTPAIRVPFEFYALDPNATQDQMLHQVDVPSFASGSYGVRDFGLGTPAMLHGREAVVTDAEFQAMTRPSTTSRDAGQMVMNTDAIVEAIRENGNRPIYLNIDGKNLVIAVADTIVKGHGRDDMINAMGLA